MTEILRKRPIQALVDRGNDIEAMIQSNPNIEAELKPSNDVEATRNNINQVENVPMPIGDLTDVDTSNKADGSVLIYNEESRKFEATNRIENENIIISSGLY